MDKTCDWKPKFMVVDHIFDILRNLKHRSSNKLSSQFCKLHYGYAFSILEGQKGPEWYSPEPVYGFFDKL